MKTGNAYVNFAKGISKLNLRNANNEKLVSIYKKYQKLVARYTFFIWAAYFLNEHYAETARQIMQKRTQNEDLHSYYEVVLAPVKRAAILELTHQVSTRQLNKKLIKELYNRYKWIPCLDIHNPAWTMKEFVAHIKEFKKKEEKAKASYEAILKKLKVNAKEKKVLDAVKQFAYIKDLRDDFRRQGIFYIQNSLFKELSNRLDLSKYDMSYLQENELVERLNRRIKSDKGIIEERKKGFVIFYDSDKEIICVSGSKIKDALIELGLEHEEHTITEIKGIVASKGAASGRVAIVKGVKDLPNVKKGDVLVAVTTHPDYVPAMQKAVAIVTEEGGVTSHAAIVSRELEIPCVVGTKIATRVLKDGDSVEVDANNGIVRILK